MQFEEIKMILMFMACSIAMFGNAIMILVGVTGTYLYEHHWTTATTIFAVTAVISSLGANLAANAAVKRTKRKA